MSKFAGTITVGHHKLSVKEFKRLKSVMENSRLVSRRDGTTYYDGHIEIESENGIHLQISLFSVNID